MPIGGYDAAVPVQNIMKNVQKLEIGFGLATLVTTWIFVFLFVFPVIVRELKDSNWNEAAWHSVSVFLFLLLPPLITSIGAVTHAIRQTRARFLLIFLGVAVLIFQFGIGFLTGVVFYFFGWVGGFFASMPGFLALATILAAWRTHKLGSEPK